MLTQTDLSPFSDSHGKLIPIDLSCVTTSDAYFFTSPKTCERSAVEASWRVENIEFMSFGAGKDCFTSEFLRSLFWISLMS